MKYEKFWVLMTESTNMKQRPLDTKYYERSKAIEAAEDKCRINRRPYYVLEAIKIVRLQDAPVVTEDLVDGSSTLHNI